MSPIPEPIIPTASMPWLTSAGEAYDRSFSGDPATAYARYVGSTAQDAFNIIYQVGQAGAFFGLGKRGIIPFSMTHPSFRAALMTEFIWGTLALSAFWLITDPDDYWTEEHAILGFHGIQQTGKPATEKEKRQAIISSEMNVYEHMRIGSMA